MLFRSGLSGSGKSSLAFDTLYAEGQRRYVESLSVYARQFLELMPRPEVESIEGLSPSISIDQKSAGSNPRSTVGTATELADYLRLLFARAGTPHCPTHGLALRADPVAAMVDRTLTLSEGVRLMVLAPIVRGGQKDVGREIEPLFVKGFTRFRIDGEVVMLERAPLPGEFEGAKDADVVVDRLRVKPDVRERLSERCAGFQGRRTGAELLPFAADGERYICNGISFGKEHPVPAGHGHRAVSERGVRGVRRFGGDAGDSAALCLRHGAVHLRRRCRRSGTGALSAFIQRAEVYAEKWNGDGGAEKEREAVTALCGGHRLRYPIGADGAFV